MGVNRREPTDAELGEAAKRRKLRFLAEGEEFPGHRTPAGRQGLWRRSALRLLGLEPPSKGRRKGGLALTAAG
jgi:hypothetical protein